MKKVLLFALVLLGTGCDVVESPYGQSNTGGGGSTGDTIVRNVLLEDFTGHHCTNCPDGHREAEALKNVYGDRLIILGVHVGIYASSTIWGPEYTYDFRTPVGDDLSLFYLGTPNPTQPIGMVNRAPYNGQKPVSVGNWGAAISTAVTEDAIAGLKVTNVSYNTSSRLISVDTETEFVQNYTANVRLAAYIVEDSIVKPQLDNGVDILNYTHRHVLRASMNGMLGDDLGGNHTQGEKINRSFSGTLVPADADPAHTSVMLILVDDVTKEVIQVIDKKIL